MLVDLLPIEPPAVSQMPLLEPRDSTKLPQSFDYVHIFCLVFLFSPYPFTYIHINSQNLHADSKRGAHLDPDNSPDILYEDSEKLA